MNGNGYREAPVRGIWRVLSSCLDDLLISESEYDKIGQNNIPANEMDYTGNSDKRMHRDGNSLPFTPPQRGGCHEHNAKVNSGYQSSLCMLPGE